MIAMVSVVSKGHDGSFAVVHVADETITFSLKEPVWLEKGIPTKGDWVSIGGIRWHGNPPKKRAFVARFASEEEIKEAKEKRKEEKNGNQEF